MFDFSFLELLLVGLIGLIVVGPERLPTVARTLGLWIGRARAVATSVRTEFEREVNATGIHETKRRLREGVSEEIKQTKQTIGELERAATHSERPPATDRDEGDGETAAADSTPSGDNAAEDKAAERTDTSATSIRGDEDAGERNQ
jgi:sec-independent protein translocase protein TatB